MFKGFIKLLIDNGGVEWFGCLKDKKMDNEKINGEYHNEYTMDYVFGETENLGQKTFVRTIRNCGIKFAKK